MKRHIFRKILGFALALALIAGIVPNTFNIYAASKPAKPKITVSVAEKDASVTLTIGKTKRADGYQVAAKLPGTKKFTELKTVELNGKKKRTFTIDNLAAGTYSIKVRAYKNSSGKKVWGKYSKVATVTVKASANPVLIDSEQVKDYVKSNYPKLYSIYESGLIDFSAEYENNSLKKINVRFGSYEIEGEKKAIEWQLLDYDEKEGKALLFSKNILDNEEFSDNEYVDSWEESFIRKKLETEYITQYFSTVEKSLIKRSEQDNGNWGPNTNDRLFLLSESELEKYIPDNKDREYSYSGEEVIGWWLRTHAYYNDAYDEDYIKYVRNDGTIANDIADGLMGIRPALYINLNYDNNTPATPAVILDTDRQEKKIELKIESIFDADGYIIYMKSEADEDFKKLTDLKKSESDYLDYSVSELEPGNYSFKVTAYRKNGKNTYEAEPALASVKLNEPDGIKTQTEEYKTVDATTYIKENYPGISVLYDNGLISLKGERKTDTIVLGSFEMEYGAAKNDEYPKTEKQPLEWEVLEYSADGKKALVISKYLICHMPFDKEGDHISWEKCSLRKWLNSDFYNNAFTDEEKAVIRLSTVEKEDITLNSQDTTEDYIFLLSESEASWRYYDNEYERIGRFVDGIADYWWLREALKLEYDWAGYDDWDEEEWDDYDEDAHVVVRDHGAIDDEDSDITFEDIGVRPSFWINLTDEIIEANNLSVKKDEDPVVEKAYILFGKNNDTENTPVEWEILDYDEKNGKVLLISRYILESRQFSSSEKKSDWKKSTLRSYLNNDFIKNTFSEKEQSMIATVTVGKAEEKVYILSGTEYDKYYDVKDYKDTDFNEDNVVYSALSRTAAGEVENIWLRTAGSKKGTAQEYLYSGQINEDSVTVKNGIRPVFWLKLN